MHAEGVSAPTSRLGLTVIRGGVASPVPVKAEAWPLRPFTFRDLLRHGYPQRELPDEVNEWRARNLPKLWRGVRRVVAARSVAKATDVKCVFGQLWLDVIRGDGEVLPLGLASVRVVTDTGVGYIVDAFQNTVELENMKFHGFGVGTNAEAAANTALQTEETTQYNPDSTRPTGSTTEGASANIYRTVATYSPDSGTNPRPITEHGVFSAASSGVMIDRSVFSVVNLVPASDSLQATYDLTFPSGG